MSSKPAERRSALAARFLAEGLVAAGVLIWWLTSLQLPGAVFPSPINVFAEIGNLAVDPEFWAAAGITGSRVLIAVLAAVFVGTTLGLLPRYLPWTSGIVNDVLIPLFTSF